MSTLHYIFDPLCGWCYAASPLVESACRIPSVRLVPHGAGLFTGPNQRTITPQWCEYALNFDQRIAQLSGQPIGKAYLDGLLQREGEVLDSAPAITAILSAGVIARRSLEMLHRVQYAHYVEGRHVSDPVVLHALAAGMGLDAQAFHGTFLRLAGGPTEQHFRETRRFMERADALDVPTLLLERGDMLDVIDMGPWLGQPEGFAQHVLTRIAD